MKYFTIFFLLITIPFLQIKAVEENKIDSWANLNHGSYKVGYKCSLVYDYSRTFKEKTNYSGDKTEGEISRPIMINIWYPAKSSSDYMKYHDYILSADLLYNPDNNDKEAVLQIYKESAAERGADINLLSNMISKETRAVKDGEASEGKFPLIIYAPSINSNPYENSIMIEFLVSQGYVVVSSPCIGFNSFEVSRDAIGSEAQTRDLEFILSYALNQKNIDRNSIGTIGFSWGGMNNIILSLRNNMIDAVVSLDGAMSMKKYKKVFDESDYYSINRMSAAFMQIIPQDQERDLSFYEAAKYSNGYILKYKVIEHNDFASDFIMKNLQCSTEPERDVNYINSVYSNNCNYILNFLNAVLKKDQSSAEYISKVHVPSGAGQDMFVHESKSALKCPPSEQEFLQLIRDNKVDQAVSIYYELKKNDPTVNFFSENSIINFMYEFGPERSDDLIKLMKMNIDAYPKSSQSYFWMAQAHMAKNEMDKAEECLQAAIKIDPENQKAVKLLSQLKK